MGGIAQNLTCWCILTTVGTDYIQVMVYWYSSFWGHFDLVKQAKCAVLSRFRDNVWEEWAEICHVYSILWYPHKWKRQSLAHANHPVTERGYPWLLYTQTSLVFCYYRPTNHCLQNTTTGGCLSGRIVIIIVLMYNQMLYDDKQPTLCFEARRKCGIGFIHNQLVSSYANAPKQLALSPGIVGFITRDFHALISRQHSQANRRGLHTFFLTSKSRWMQK